MFRLNGFRVPSDNLSGFFSDQAWSTRSVRTIASRGGSSGLHLPRSFRPRGKSRPRPRRGSRAGWRRGLTQAPEFRRAVHKQHLPDLSVFSWLGVEHAVSRSHRSLQRYRDYIWREAAPTQPGPAHAGASRTIPRLRNRK